MNGAVVTIGRPGFAATIDLDPTVGLQPGDPPMPLENVDLTNISFTTVDPLGGGDVLYAEAGSDCAGLSYAGMTGWRLPSWGEAMLAGMLGMGTLPGYTTTPVYTQVNSFEETALFPFSLQNALDQCYIQARGAAQELCIAMVYAEAQENGWVGIPVVSLTTGEMTLTGNGEASSTVCVNDGTGS